MRSPGSYRWLYVSERREGAIYKVIIAFDEMIVFDEVFSIAAVVSRHFRRVTFGIAAWRHIFEWDYYAKWTSIIMFVHFPIHVESGCDESK